MKAQYKSCILFSNTQYGELLFSFTTDGQYMSAAQRTCPKRIKPNTSKEDTGDDDPGASGCAEPQKDSTLQYSLNQHPDLAYYLALSHKIGEKFLEQ